MELKSHVMGSKTSLRHYYLVGIKGLTLSSALEGSSVELFVSFWNSNLRPNRYASEQAIIH